MSHLSRVDGELNCPHFFPEVPPPTNTKNPEESFSLVAFLHGLFSERNHLRAAALSFHTLLGLVPFLSILFAFARWTGLYERFLKEFILPGIDRWFGPRGKEPSHAVSQLRLVVDSAIEMAQSASPEGMGITGGLVLFYSLFRIMRNIEDALSESLGISCKQPMWERTRSIGITLLVAPLGLTYGVIGASASHWIDRIVPWTWIRVAAQWFSPLLLAFLAIFVMYRFLSPLSISSKLAASGALCASGLWFAVQVLHIDLQVGIARWNAVYAGLGAFPIALANIQLSWVILLAGADSISQATRAKLHSDRASHKSVMTSQ
ncbi:MAG: YihY/virulence factor BrkB family protein [Sandaracinaceae bacterium]|nr:YihY/virulence factor BrkB family protein [Sandaracinaceae bacterium]